MRALAPARKNLIDALMKRSVPLTLITMAGAVIFLTLVPTFLRPAKSGTVHDRYSPGLHHLCFRVESELDVVSASAALRAAVVEATEPRRYPEYAPDYFATFFADPDGVRLEITNYRKERRDRHDRWNEIES